MVSLSTTELNTTITYDQRHCLPKTLPLLQLQVLQHFREELSENTSMTSTAHSEKWELTGSNELTEGKESTATKQTLKTHGDREVVEPKY